MIWGALLAFGLSLLLAGCTVSEPRADLVILNGTEPESLDPAIVTGISEMRITRALFEGLLRLDPQTARPIPGLAERWAVSSDGLIYTFHLRTNLTWSTGEPITSDDVLYSWLRALSPATAADYAGQLFCLKNAEPFYLGALQDPAQVGVRTRGPHTIEAELEQPLAFFPDLCTLPILSIVPRRAIQTHADRWLSANPLPSSGPYLLEEWRLNYRVRLRKNPRYWDAANTQSEVIDLLPVGSPNAALNLYVTGAADIIWDKDLIPLELLDVLRSRPDFHTFDYLGTSFFRMNVTRQPLDDPRVRRAFALATDQDRLTRRLLEGVGRPAYSLVPTGTANYEPPAGLSPNVEQARRLLAEAGFPDGKGFPRLEYSFFTAGGAAGKLQGKLAVELQQMWREALGISIELRQVERKVFFAAQSRLDYDLSASSWVGDYNDANTFLDLFLSNSGNNRTGWKSSRYDQLIREANRQTDLRRRADLFRQAENLLVSEEVVIVPLYFYVGVNCFDPRQIQGLYQNLLDEHPLQAIRRVGP